MRGRIAAFAGALALVCLGWTTASTQTANDPETRLDLAEVRSLRKQIAGNAALDSDVQAACLESYDAAISSLESLAEASSAVRRFRREEAGVESMVEALRAELSEPPRKARVSLRENATAEQAQSALARERSRLAAYRSALREAESLSEERANQRNDISRQLGTLDQEIEALTDEIRVLPRRDLSTDLKEATRIKLIAAREAKQARIERFRAELEWLDAQGKVIPWEVDQAQRRVDYGAELVDLLEAETTRLRHEEAASSLDRVREQCRQAAELGEPLAGIAAEVEEFAALLWGADGVELEAQRATRRLVVTRKHMSDLERMVQLTRRKFAAFGYRGSINRWWPDVPDGFPSIADISGALRRLELEVPEIQHDQIRFEQQRAKIRDLSEQTMSRLQEESSDGALDPELERTAHELLVLRRELLDDLIQRYGRYANQLVELQAASTSFLAETERLTAFLYERLLWVRSVPRPIVPRPGQLVAAAGWLASNEDWSVLFSTVRDAGRTRPVLRVGFVLLLLVVVVARGRIRRRLARIATQAADPEQASHWTMFESLVYTLLLAAPLPLALFALSRILQGAEDSQFVFALSQALYYLAGAAGLLELTRQLIAPQGLAESCFGWPATITRRFYNRMLWPEVVFLALMAVALPLAMAGIRLSSPPELQVYNNALGRAAFVIAMVVFGSSLLAIFWPQGKTLSGLTTGTFRGPPSQRLYVYIYPLTLFALLLPAVLAALGFYVTGLLLAYQMLRTLWLVLILVIVVGLMFRWHAVSRQRPEGNAGATAVDGPEVDLQVRKLLRFVVALIAAFGLFAIWSSAVPTLQIMKRVELWPQIALVEAAASDPLAPVTSEKPAAPGTTDTPVEEGASSPTAVVPGLMGGEAGATATTPDASPLTLWNVFQCLLALLIVVVLVRNVPGLLELILRRRTLLDSGARIAFSTLVRYVILIFGVSAAFGFLGISWSKIQWLAAALTFGLGFGLQEIVANFVSGLILLMERPVRVGDAVTIGNLQGVVSQIRIRATTITLWDRSEMIVPNKEFITTKLINWTLSDSRRRLEIPVRIRHGADLEQVKSILVELAGLHPDVLEDPAPHALLMEFGPDAIHFQLRVFVDFGKGLSTRDELQMAIDKAFTEHRIEFAIPALKLDIPRRGPGKPKG